MQNSVGEHLIGDWSTINSVGEGVLVVRSWLTMCHGLMVVRSWLTVSGANSG